MAEIKTTEHDLHLLCNYILQSGYSSISKETATNILGRLQWCESFVVFKDDEAVKKEIDNGSYKLK